MVHIPHHGLIKKSNVKLLQINRYKDDFFFTNASSGNSHGHPRGNVKFQLKKKIANSI